MNGPYDVIMCDPPWPSRDPRGHAANWDKIRERRASGERDLWDPYALLTLADVATLLDTEILSQAAAQHVVFLWSTEHTLHTADALMTERGYRMHTRFVWDKGNGPLLGPGTVRRVHEYLTWWSMPPLLTVERTARGRFSTIIRESSREHSRKPNQAYQMVEALYPHARRLDAFTREYRENWEPFGDQVDHFTPLLAPLRQKAPERGCDES